MTIRNHFFQFLLSRGEKNEINEILDFNQPSPSNNQPILMSEEKIRSNPNSLLSLAELSVIKLCTIPKENHKEEKRRDEFLMNIFSSHVFFPSVLKKYKEASSYYSPSLQEFHLDNIKLELLSKFSFLFKSSHILFYFKNLFDPIIMEVFHFLEKFQFFQKNSYSFRYLLQTIGTLKLRIFDYLFSFFCKEELSPKELISFLTKELPLLINQKMLFIIWSGILCLRVQIYITNQSLMNESIKIDHSLEKGCLDSLLQELEFCFQIEKCLIELDPQKEPGPDYEESCNGLSKKEIAECMMGLLDQLYEIKSQPYHWKLNLVITCFTNNLNRLEDFNIKNIETKLVGRFPFIKKGRDSQTLFLDHKWSNNDIDKKVFHLFYFCKFFSKIEEIEHGFVKLFFNWSSSVLKFSIFDPYFLGNSHLKENLLRFSHNRIFLLDLLELIDFFLVCSRIYLKAKIYLLKSRIKFEDPLSPPIFSHPIFLEDFNQIWNESIYLERSVAQFRSGIISVKELFKILNIG